MGYWTSFNGELTIELKEPYLGILRVYLDKTFDNKEIIFVNETTLRVSESWKNGYGVMEDIVLFIERFGVLKSGVIHCSGEENEDLWNILIRDHKSWIQRYGYNPSNEKISSIDELKETFEEEEGIQSYQFSTKENLSDEEMDLVQKVERFLESFMDYDTDDLDLFFSEAQTGFDKKWIEEIQFSFQETYYIWRNYGFVVNDMNVISEEKLKLDLHPFLAQYHDENLFISNAEIDLKEPRKMETSFGLLPLVEVLMTPTYSYSEKEFKVLHGENSVILEDGNRCDPCDVCIHRLEKVTSGCKKCVPKKISL